MKELPKAYEPQMYEDNIYQKWEESGYFNPDNLDGEPYTIMMPPPNVTGILHLGHVLEHTLMDIVIRYHRMQGKKALLVPGTDHAAVATQAKVESLLMKDGMEHPRKELGRDGLLEKIREFAEESKSTILTQIRKLGTSADWSRLAYTFDEERSKAVNTVFVKMFEDGLIYKGYRVVNWSVKGQSTCSDDELVHVDRKGMLYTFKYSEDFPITIATTRPETKVGDTAVAVHPEDARYKEYIGKTFDLIFCGVDISLKVIADDHVDPAFGTGALGVTPAHSPTDFEMYEQHNATGDTIELIQVIGEDGKMTDKAGKFAGQDVLEARANVIEELKEKGLLVSEEEVDQNVGTSDRFKDVVEALPKTQWFVAVNKKISGRGKSLKELVLEATTTGHNGDPTQKINVLPENQFKRHIHRIQNLHDWCISRQIWWGHRIPVWYRGEEVFAGIEPPEGEGWVQDEDTLDTWFSSGMWTFATLGWASGSEDVKTFHPTNFMQMGHEILFLWFQRMVMMSTYALDQIPFKDVYIHGLVRNKDGKKFSKSDGNTADPIDVIEQYGTDALRFSMISGIAPGNDLRFSDEKIESMRNLVNKLWNIFRFTLINIDEPKKDIVAPEGATLADKWILARTAQVVQEVTDHIENYRFSPAAELLRDFTWNELADWYLEIAKVEGSKSDVLNHVLNTILKLWHPYMPFVTEAIWQEVYGEDEMLMVEKWPKVPLLTKDGVGEVSRHFGLVQEVITSIRSLRAEKKIDAGKELTVVIVCEKEQALLDENAEVIKGLARVGSLTIAGKDAQKPEQSASAVVGGVTIYFDLAGAVDVEAEKIRLQKEIDHVSPYITSLEKKLGNAGFTDNAPEQVLEVEKKKLAEAQAKLAALQKELESLV